MTTIPTSAAKRAANQKNSQRSTGPGTTAGKAKMRNNALRHGLTSRHPVIDGEDREEYESLRLDLLADWQPVDTHESSIVTEIAGAAWRTMQALRIETETYQNYCEDAALTEDADAETAACFPENAKFFDNLRHNSTTIERRFYRAIAELRKLRTERKKCDRGSVSQNATERIVSSAQCRPNQILNLEATNLALFRKTLHTLFGQNRKPSPHASNLALFRKTPQSSPIPPRPPHYL